MLGLRTQDLNWDPNIVWEGFTFFPEILFDQMFFEMAVSLLIILLNWDIQPDCTS